MALSPGTKLGAYEIVAPLGAGGMGEVYRAHDTKLGRDVALKMLPSEMARDPQRLARFRREAKALAQLDHPNIITIHSVEECDGIHFLTMQLVEGLPLDRLIPLGGLPVERIFEIASALGEALAAAHEKGIVHRDLKPSGAVAQKSSPAMPSASRAFATAGDSGASRSDSGASRMDEGFWVAVLPFKCVGGNADLAALADGLTEDIVTGMSRFSYLRVISRGSTARYAGESVDVRVAGKELGARYVLEGSLRQAGNKVRVAVQLIDAVSGANLWAEAYSHPFTPETIFDVQDELVPRIVATVADTRGVLCHIMSEPLRARAADQLTPYEAVLRSFAYLQRVSPEDHAAARVALEHAVEQAPANANAWAMLGVLYREEYAHNFNLLPDPIGRAYAAAQRAVELAPSNHDAYHALASALFFRKERIASRTAAERAIELNSMDGFNFAYMAMLIAYDGNWKRGLELSERARSLNPHHPGWYWFVPILDAYNRHDYRAALEFALKVNMPGFWRTQCALAICYGQLGELQPARAALQELLKIRPNFAIAPRDELEKWHDAALIDNMLDGLRKAGLEIGDPSSPQGAASR
jgi:TolB-like protein